MSARIPVPDAHAVAYMLEALTGIAVSADAVDDKPDTAPNDLAAVYVLDDETVAAIAILSLPLAVTAGAALGMVPQPDEAEVKAMQAVPEHLMANVNELVNIFAQLLNSDVSPHVRLAGLQGFGDLEGDAASLVSDAERRVDFAVELVDRRGSLCFLTKSVAK